MWPFALGALVLHLTLKLTFAQSCTPTPAPSPEQCPPNINDLSCPTPAPLEVVDPLDPTPDPPVESIPSQFQPPDGSQLTWQKYIPAGTGPFPTVLVFHGGEFKGGDARDVGVQKVCRDLKSKGFLALAVNYRLAACGRITGQDPNFLDRFSGRPPQQTDDAKTLVKAARSLAGLCNGNVGVLGGSTGGSHAVFIALDKTQLVPERN